MLKPKGYDEPEFYTDYHEYMKSMKWQTLRLKRLEIDGYKCARQGCGCTTNI